MPEIISQMEYDWLCVFLVYNNKFYDREHLDTDRYFTMEEQKRNVFHQLKDSIYSERIKIVIVEAIAEVSEEGFKATIHVVEKTKTGFGSLVEPTLTRNPATMASSVSIEGILNLITGKIRSKRNMIVTVGHGSVVGINYTFNKLKPNYFSKLSNTNNLVKERQGLTDHTIPPFFEITIPLTTTEINKIIATEYNFPSGISINLLTNYDINTAIKSVFKEKKLDVLVMYNCLMQNIFTQYELKDTVNWLVAPLSGICYPGYNYLDTLNELSKNPTMDSKSLSCFLLDAIRNHRNYKDSKANIEMTWMIYALQLNEPFYVRMQSEFNAFFDQLHSSFKKNRRMKLCLEDTVRYLFNYATYSLPELKIIDLKIFLMLLRKRITETFPELSTLVPSIDSFMNLINQHSEKHCFRGTLFFSSEYKYFDEDFVDEISGIGLVFPTKRLKSELLSQIFDSTNYSPSPKRPEIPSILDNSFCYADTVNKYIAFLEIE